MQLIIFLVEVIAIYAFLEYDTLSHKFNNFKLLEESNSSYSSENAIQQVLALNNISDSKKIALWSNSPIKDELLTHFPNLHLMSKIIDTKVIDDGDFKYRLISNLEYLHGEYISQNIDIDKYREKIQNPDPSLPAF
ncbi:hypothetical protein GSY74_08590 [Sulfurovum sp. bin170]|uniref:hypothetical protein n=1 Tax=Sulfurovum sp. bin170 TaxID=2695268 RepID=UPI0013DE9C44|nr:hypothetical protein [Sulfurovum sp. bin170]NEW61340.1 hypothetical protein [Sulfurovum sp. bin170]